VEDDGQRHRKRRDQDEREYAHRACGRHPAAELGHQIGREHARAHADGHHQVEQAEHVPGDREAVRARRPARQRERHHRAGDADEDVAPARRLGEVGGELAEREEDHEQHAEGAIHLDANERRQRRGLGGAPERGREEKGEQGDDERRSDEERDERSQVERVAAGERRRGRGQGERDAEPAEQEDGEPDAHALRRRSTQDAPHGEGDEGLRDDHDEGDGPGDDGHHGRPPTTGMCIYTYYLVSASAAASDIG